MKDLGRTDSIKDIVSKKVGVPDIVELLSQIPLTQLNSILIEASKERAAKIGPLEVLRNYDSKPEFYGISCLDKREIIKFESAFYSVLPERFQAVEVSPISPLGTNSVITRISQNNTMTTIRGSEVVSDPTTSLILECASRRKQLVKKKETLFNNVELATFQRVLRLQPFDKTKGYMQHFNLIGITTAGRDKEFNSFVPGATMEHISVWLDFVNHLNKNGYSFENISVNISNVQFLEAIIKKLDIPRDVINRNSLNEDFDFFKHFNINLPNEVSSIHEIDAKKAMESGLTTFVYRQFTDFERQALEPLKEKYPNVRFCFDFNRKAGLGYYKDFCFHIFATNKDGRQIQLVDGGSVDWVEKLLTDKKEQAVTSGFGAELIQKLFVEGNTKSALTNFNLTK